MGYKVGMLGMGHFGRHFVPLFKAHPLVDEVVVAELREDVRAEVAKENEIERTCADLDELLKTDIDAVAIFTQRWSHAPQAIASLKAGKHVYSAVPAGVTVEELDELVKTVEQTGLTYALGETSFYRPQATWCRQRFAEGKFGRFVYGEGQYYHNMAHWFYLPFYDANGPEWKKYASVPPMWYISHSASHILSVTRSHFTHVSCFGWVDDHEDGLFDRDLSAFDNPWSNQTALFRTADGGMARVNEFRRSAAGESRGSIIGTLGAYQEQCNPHRTDVSVREQIEGNENDSREVELAASSAVWTEQAFEKPPYKEDGSYDYENAQHWSKKVKEDVTWIHRMPGTEITEANLGDLPREYIGKKHLGTGPLHPVERLPKEFVGMRNGHCGSHQFLVHDFLEAIETGKLPPCHVWAGARWSVGGAVAHESCKREGERLAIPQFGRPPADASYINPLTTLLD